MDRLWLDAHDYGARLLLAGAEPWLTPATVGPFYGELAALLRPHRLIVPVAPLLRANLDEAGSTTALYRIVESDGVARALENGLATLGYSGAAGLLVPSLLGPTMLGLDPDDEDALDDGVAALGSLLRQLVGVALSGTILIDEPEAAARDALGPLHRIAEHGGMELRVVGQGIDTVGWEDLEGHTSTHDTLVTIPADAEPEAVLARLARIRSRERGL